ncbi:hypothetical protein BKA69DRAFT_1089919 [Paraphysoderma sedebokerense]|nr:hypothetical protein BKA69DRAFT_1089919 [Paraphysoderma sedebokerense]
MVPYHHLLTLKLSIGSVYVWDQDEAGIIRWTDDRKWSNSKNIGDFVGYIEATDNSVSQHSTSSNSAPPEPLNKKVISFETKERRKFHLVAYYFASDVKNGYLNPPPGGLINIPPRYYKRLRQNKDMQIMSQIYASSLESSSFDHILTTSNTFDTQCCSSTNLDHDESTVVLPSVSGLLNIADQGSMSSTNSFSDKKGKHDTPPPWKPY